MSIRALHYITGDTPQSGFRRIGGTDAFPADQVPWLNNGDPIKERSRIEKSTARPAAGGFQSQIWEYQTGRYGMPVIIYSAAATGSGRSHAYSEYICGETEHVAEAADAGAMIRGAEGLQLLSIDEFMKIPGREEIRRGEEEWIPREAAETATEEQLPDALWLLTVLSRYWEQASVRAFSENTPDTVHVNLGELGKDMKEETTETIRRAKMFFSNIICPRLPRQVQNIASMAAGVNCGDEVNLYTALEFDISQNLFGDETLMLERPRELRKYRLNQAEEAFIREVSTCKTPEYIQTFFENYKNLTNNVEATLFNTPFMADYRVWYALYCAEEILRKGHTFIQSADLMKEHGNPNPIRDARACYLLIRRLRTVLENDHGLKGKKDRDQQDLVSGMIESVETGLMQFMLKDMQDANAQPFMLFRNEKTDFFRRYLYTAQESQKQLMIDLTVRDEQASKVPQFVRCYPSVPLRTETEDRLSAGMMNALLPSVIRPIIEEEKAKGSVENKYLDYLRSETFADQWACLSQHRHTQEAFATFFRGEIEDCGKHFLLYKITLKYLPETELLKTTLKHFTELYSAPGMRPNKTQIAIAAYSAKDYIAREGSADPGCVAAMNGYYQKCFQEYGREIGGIKEIVSILGGDTTGTLMGIFEDAARKDLKDRMLPEEAKAVFDTFGGEEGRYAKTSRVEKAFTGMIDAQTDKAMQSGDSSVVSWIGNMLSVSQKYFRTDTTESLRKIVENGKDGNWIKPSDMRTAFFALGPQAEDKDTRVLPVFSEMLTARRKAARQNGDSEAFAWLNEMTQVCPWKDRLEWMNQQRTENTVLACDLSMGSGQTMDGTTVSVIRQWLEEKSVQYAGQQKLQQYCETQMDLGDKTAADIFLPFFEQIDTGNERLRAHVFEQAQTRLAEGLEKKTLSFGDLVSSCKKDVSRSGRQMDDLYNASKEPVESYLKKHFEAAADVNSLIQEQELLPENSEFYRSWQRHLSDRISDQQIELFNRQPNLEKMMELRDSILARTDINEALTAAYEMIEGRDGYEQCLNRMAEGTEYEAIANVGSVMSGISRQLHRAEAVRKTLCGCLRNTHYAAQSQLQTRSFRHALCGSMIRAMLTDSGDAVDGGPDWHVVLNAMFQRAEIEESTRSPYKSNHLPVLQKLLALVENVKLMEKYGMNPEWTQQLIKTIHTDTALHAYQNALGRNKKKKDLYLLDITGEGIQFT